MKKIGLLIGLCCSIGLVNGQVNTSYGTGAGTGGVGSTFLGYYSGQNTSGSSNVGVGHYALRLNTSGYNNVGIGSQSLYNNITGSKNVASGHYAMRNNETGYENAALGANALEYNISGRQNTAVGSEAMNKNTTGYFNTAIGAEALINNTTGTSNTSTGYRSMLYNTTGSYNVGYGIKALYSNITGRNNTASGWEASIGNTTGNYNTSHGYRALRYNTTGSYNVGLGHNATTSSGGTYNYSTAIGAYSTVTASQQVRVGASWMQSIGGYQNWTNLSDGRFKKEVKEDVLGLDFIKQLRPVSYYVDNKAVKDFLGVELEHEAIDKQKRYQTGFIAQEVEATAKELGFNHFGGVDAPENEESHYGLRYAEFVVPLVKSVQELSEQNERLNELIAQQQIQINDLLEAKQGALNSAVISRESEAKLYQNIPNPFTNETQIKLFVPEAVGQALIQVCTIDGKQLFVKEVTGRDETSITLSGNDLPAGIYMYTLIVDNTIVTSKRMVLTK